jgi:hypothetical protein
MKFACFMPLFAVALCMTGFMSEGADFQQSPTQDSMHSTSDAPVYLPPGQTEASILTVFLYSLSEPSLLEAAKDASVISFRMSYFSPQPGKVIVVRLVVNADGSGQTISAVSSSGKSDEFKNTKVSVSASDVQKFLQLVEKVGFWSMPSIEKKNEGGRKMYVFDGAWWMVEGVRNKSFHYVFRRNPGSSSFTEIGRDLAKNLAKIDNSAQLGIRGSGPSSRDSSPPF